MSTEAKGTYQVTSWDENQYDEKEGTAKLTKARITQTFSGDIEGEGTSDYLMVYPSDSEAHFVGVHRVVGTLGGRSGSFALSARGVFANGTVETQWEVVPGSGTGELAGLVGSGGYTTVSATEAEVRLSYGFEV
jgi:hypothetical protein